MLAHDWFNTATLAAYNQGVVMMTLESSASRKRRITIARRKKHEKRSMQPRQQKAYKLVAEVVIGPTVVRRSHWRNYGRDVQGGLDLDQMIAMMAAASDEFHARLLADSELRSQLLTDSERIIVL